MRGSATGADAQNEAVARGSRMATKRKITKGKGVAPLFWTPEMTKLDKMVQECKNRRRRDALIHWRRKVLADTALGRWKENVAKLSATHSVNWNLVKSISVPRVWETCSHSIFRLSIERRRYGAPRGLNSLRGDWLRFLEAGGAKARGLVA
ncbi:hypothetical protein ERJ75_001518400 [Trypanosoma vivax]|nr:hypothetical protein ERJ75_001518400 [Trypanosoma vivax]